MISVNQLTKTYGQKVILDQVSFEIGAGEMVGLIGPNGVGKTTLLSIMMGLIKADSGTVAIAGIDHRDVNMYRKVGFMQDNTVLYPHLTGYDHLAYVANAHGLQDEAIERISLRVGNHAYLHQKVEEYSLGMKQHLLFACAIIHQPDVLLLDEPFNGLDPTSLIRIRDLIIELSEQQGVTVFLSSHNLDEIDRMTKKIFFLNNGVIIHKQLQNYEEDQYLLTLDHAVVVDASQAGVEQINSKQLLVEAVLLEEVLKHLSGLGVHIQAIDRQTVGSEKLYREIYQI